MNITKETNPFAWSLLAILQCADDNVITFKQAIQIINEIGKQNNRGAGVPELMRKLDEWCGKSGKDLNEIIAFVKLSPRSDEVLN